MVVFEDGRAISYWNGNVIELRQVGKIAVLAGDGFLAPTRTRSRRCPQKPELKKLWTDFLYLHLGNSVSVNNFFLCSFHFEEKCFDRTSAQKVVLRPHSVPTISYTYEERITNVVTFRGNETHHTEVCDAPSVEPQQNIEDELSNKVFEITKKLENLTTKTCANVLLKQQINNLKTLVSQQQCTIKTLKRRTSKQQRKICNLKDVVSSLRKKINYYENNSVDVNKFQENTELLSRIKLIIQDYFDETNTGNQNCEPDMEEILKLNVGRRFDEEESVTTMQKTTKIVIITFTQLNKTQLDISVAT
ncbi:hypothetical protein Zmor_006454 [Zophobas morio]|uniref:THAP-type domain-containing protein n=1 Tax=Zophobas morio TaxID=2755281 RepID=A0AA38MNE9_9CUCU|nr:hypothetical protein Zmor_006454 [Zophobas morio]